MKKGRSTYSVQFNVDQNTINNLMQSYLNAENFKTYEKNGEQYFRSGDQMLGYKGLKYSINGQTLTIDTWLDGMLNNFSLENSGINVMAMNYRNSLNKLFQEVSKLNKGNNSMDNQFNIQNNENANIQNNNQQIDANNINQFAQNFKNENIKKQETLCEIGFWISILGLFASLFGVAYGVIVYIIDFYFASQGLKTRKRGKAIATIVLSIISILIIMIQIIVA